MRLWKRDVHKQEKPVSNYTQTMGLSSLASYAMVSGSWADDAMLTFTIHVLTYGPHSLSPPHVLTLPFFRPEVSPPSFCSVMHGWGPGLLRGGGSAKSFHAPDLLESVIRDICP